MMAVDRMPPRGEGLSHGAWYRLALLLLTLATLALYLTGIEAKGIWWDESLSLYRARLPVAEILSNRITYSGSTSVDLHPPLYFVLLHGLVRVFGESDVVLRLLSACSGALLVPLLYATGARLRGQRAGLLAAALGATSPLTLWYAQEARMYTLVTLLCLMVFYCLWRSVAEGRRMWALGVALCTGAALATQYLSALLLAALAIAALAMWRARRVPGKARRGSRSGALAVAAAAALLVLVAAWYGRTALGVLRQPAAGREYVPFGEMLRDALNSFSLGATVDAQAVLPLNLAFLAVFVAGLASLWQHAPAALAGEGTPSSAERLAGPAALVGALIVPITGMWVYSLAIGPIYMGSRYVIMSLPFFTLGLGLGVDAICRWRAPAGRAAAVLLIASMGVSDVRYFCHPDYATKEDHRATAERVAAEEAPGDAILLTAPENITAFEHYYDGRLPIYPVPSVALSGAQSPEVIDADLRAIVDQGYRRLWLVHCRTQHSDPDDGVMAWLEANALLLERTVYTSKGSTATVSAWLPGLPVSSGEPVEEPLGVFGERLALESLTLESEMAATRGDSAAAILPVEAGRSVVVRTRLRALDTLRRYKLSLRLRDDAGAVWAQDDGYPYMYLPTDEWPVGSAMDHDARLRVRAGTPPGVYRLELVVYEELSGQALAYRPAGALESGVALDAGRVTVTRNADSPARADVLVPGIEKARVSARFGKDLTLWAWWSAPAALSPGGRLFLNVFWEARRTPAEDYLLVVNLQGEDGGIWHTSEHPLTGVDAPATGWQAGELMRGIVPIDLPADAPVGRNTVHLLVYAPASRSFLWVGRGLWPWTGRQVTAGAFTVQ